MRYLILLLALAVSACSGAPSHELPQTSEKDPIWQLNPDKWTFGVNDLVQSPPVRRPIVHGQQAGL